MSLFDFRFHYAKFLIKILAANFWLSYIRPKGANPLRWRQPDTGTQRDLAEESPDRALRERTLAPR